MQKSETLLLVILDILENDQQPKELAIISRVPHRILAEQYPDAKKFIYQGPAEEENQPAYSTRLDYGDRVKNWAGSNGDGKIVVEYKDGEGTYVFLPENRKIIDFMENH